MRIPALVCLCFALPARAADEPKLSYGDKTLGAWVAQLHDADPHARKRAADALADATRLARGTVRPLVAKLMAVNAPDEEEEVRRLVAYGDLLRQIGPAAAEVLHGHLWGDDAALKLRALRLLALMERHAWPAVPGLLEVLETDRDEKRLGMALLAVSRSNDPAFRPVLLKLLRHEDIERWRPAADILARGNYPTADFLPTLRKWLRGDNADRRRAALAALAALGREAAPAAEDLAAILRREEQIERTAALMILGRIAGPAKSAAPALETLLKDGSDRDKLAAAQALVRVANHAGAREFLLKTLKDGSAVNRLEATTIMWWRARSPEVPVALKWVLAEGTPGERHEAARLAGRLGPSARETVPELVKLLEGPAKGLQGEAIEALGRIGPDAKDAVKALRRAAEVYKEEQPRSLIVLALARIEPDKAVIDELAGFLKSQDRVTRWEMVEVLGGLGGKAKAAVPEVRRLLDEADPTLRAQAVAALWLITQDATLLGELQKRLRSEDIHARRHAAALVGELAGADAGPAVGDLVRMIWDDPADAGAIEALGRVGPAAKKAVPALTRLVRTPGLEEHMYSSAAEALGLIGAEAKPAAPDLTALLGHPSAYVRAHAALALVRLRMPNKDAETVIEQCTMNRNARVIITAREAEWLLRKEAHVVEDLVLILRAATFSDDPAATNIRFMAARALSRIGPEAKSALPDLNDLLYDYDPNLRRYVREAIGMIEGKK